MLVYTVIFEHVTVSASQDFLEITPADDKPLKLLGLTLDRVGGTADVGDAQCSLSGRSSQDRVSTWCLMPRAWRAKRGSWSSPARSVITAQRSRLPLPRFPGVGGSAR